MIKEIRLKNWKSFRDAVLPIDPLTILIGANASGKSNAIDALEFLERIAYGKELRPALAGDSTLAPIRGGVEGAVLQGEKSLTIATMLGKNSFTIETLIGDDEGNDYIHSITVNNGTLVNALSVGQDELHFSIIIHVSSVYKMTHCLNTVFNYVLTPFLI